MCRHPLDVVSNSSSVQCILNIVFFNIRDVGCRCWASELVCGRRRQGCASCLCNKLCWTSLTCCWHIPSSPWMLISCCGSRCRRCKNAEEEFSTQVILSSCDEAMAKDFTACSSIVQELYNLISGLLKVGRVSGINYSVLFIFQLHCTCNVLLWATITIYDMMQVFHVESTSTMTNHNRVTPSFVC